MSIFIKLLLQGVMAFFACFFFAIVYKTPKKMLLLCGLAGGLGYITYFGLNNYILIDSYIPAFFGTLVIVICAKFFTVNSKTPIMLFILPAVYPIVPGAAMYKCALELYSGNYYSAEMFAVQAFKTISMVTISLLIFLPVPIQKILKKNRSREAEQSQAL